MRNKLLAVKDFEMAVEVSENVTKLPKEVREIGHQMETNASVYDAIDEEK